MCAPEENDFVVTFLKRQELVDFVQNVYHIAASPKNDSNGCFFQGWQVGKESFIRRLTSQERDTIQNKCRCQANDWSTVYLILKEEESQRDQSELLQRLLFDTRFDGVLIFDLTDPEPHTDTQELRCTEWHRLPVGIHSNLMITDSVFRLKSCRVYKNAVISNTYVGSHTTILQCGCISANPEAIYGRLSLSVGPESGGGRILNVTAEHTMIDICRRLRDGPGTHSPLQVSQTPFNVIGDGCTVRNSATIQNVFLHDYSSIEAASSVSDCTLYPQSAIRGSCSVRNVLMQWDSCIIDNSNVTDALLMEQAHVGPNSIVSSTVLGPDVHVSAGEVHASVIGPNTNAHHQSLLIGVLWPMGRGNVGYGANVGSNHTCRLPDQETVAGEGLFWGLSNVIKFPVDLSFSPYSIVAAGTTLPPQRICLPFSLIVDKGSSNEIIPGWVLQSSPYTLVRSEKKYATRRKAKRHHHYTGWKIFRPEIMAMCFWARKTLESGNALGIGACELSGRARDVGIRAYTECLQRYALQGLFRWILSATDSGKMPLDVSFLDHELSTEGRNLELIINFDPSAKVDWPIFPWDCKGISEWDYQKYLLAELFPWRQNKHDWLEDVLLKLVALEKDLSQRIEKSKRRDDSRGTKTIPGYTLAHTSADKDTVIQEARLAVDQIDSAVADILTTTGTRSRL